MKFIYLIVITLAILACGNEKLNEAELIEKAKVSLEQGEHRSAVINLKNVLQKNANSVEARWLLGGIYLDLDDGVAAEKELSKALNLGVSSDAAKPLLLKSLLAQGKYDEVINLDVDDLQTASSISIAQAAKGLAYYSKKEFKSADEFLSLALMTAPDSNYALTGKAQLKIAKRQLSQARLDLEQVLKSENENAFAWNVMGDLEQEDNNYDKAMAAYTNALKHKKNNATYLIKRVFLSVRMKQYEKAQADISALKKRFSNSSQVSYAQGILYFYQENFDKAETELEDALRFNSGNEWASYYLGVSQFMLSKFESAQNNLDNFVASHPKFMPARKFLALVNMRENEFEKAELMIRPVLKRNPKDVFAISILANSLLKQGESGEAVRLFEEVVQLKPESAGGYLKLGVGLMTEGQRSKGFESLEKAVEINPDFEQAQIVLILGYIKENKLTKAKQAVNAFIEKQPDNVVAYNLLGKVFVEEKNYDEASIQFKKAQQLKPSDPESNILLGAIAMEKGDFGEASDYFNKTLKFNPGYLHALLSLAAVKAREHDREGVKKVLLSAIEAHPKAVRPRLLLAKEYLKRRLPAKGVRLLNEVKEDNWGDINVTSMLVELQMSLGQFAEAQSILNRAMLVQPKSAINHTLLARAYGGSKNIDQMQHELNAALKLKPDSLEPRFMMARLMLSLGKLDSATKNLEQLKKYAGKEQFNVLALEAALFEKRGKIKHAEVKFKQLYADYANSKNALLALTRFQWRIGKKAESTQIMTNWLEKHPKDINVLLELANNYLVLGKKNEAIVQYQKVHDISPNNVIALNNLAYNLAKENSLLALTYANKARELAPKSLMVLDTLVSVLLEAGQSAKALELARQLVKQKPDNVSYRLRLASAQEQNGKINEALNTLKAALNGEMSVAQKSVVNKMLARLQQE